MAYNVFSCIEIIGKKLEKKITMQHSNTITNAIHHFVIATRTATKLKLRHPDFDCSQANR